MPRYVLLFHDCPPSYARPSHWDFMLEDGASLRTWALPRLPIEWRTAYECTESLPCKCPPIAESNSVSVQVLDNHRLDYLDYEGEVSGRHGQVHRVAAGTYKTVDRSQNVLRIRLEGVLRGMVTLETTSAETPSQEWLLSVTSTT